MTLLRRNSNFGSYDIAPQLQATLNANGMQAHLSQTPSGEMQLITLAHNSSTPRYYTLTQSQVENLRSGGTNSFNRKAYETFTSIVKNDYYMPNAWVTAKNANSPVNMGQWGHTIMDGEYGYREPKFHPFMGAKYGKFNSFMDRLSLLPQRGYHVRRIEGRPFFASSAPVVVDRPDGRLKPGELKSGAYGFYDKGTQVADPLHVSSKEVSRVTLSEPVNEVIQIGTKAPITGKGSSGGKVITTGGRFVWPAIGATSVSSGYGGARRHGGIDIVKPGGGSTGLTIVAAASGTVTTATYHPSWGFYIVINHGNGLSTLYAHTLPGSFKVRVGQKVSAGQPIANIGSSGNVTGPHLHFEVYVNGRRTNPMPYLGR